ncbi:uncharacterized protein LOC122017158 [Zingiber officinale]|uniref:Uncharacterized protein n=1 Tax=Zingiber officinale TaxID=94328 RepID=A0A8J5KHM0_ZINOF|nr:uncharacterized protein LOC122017158 [Zingiber officinale]KAG6481639.1 hypothetical protein ZIOFF_058243 [Zingiber officinale]
MATVLLPLAVFYLLGSAGLGVQATSSGREGLRLATDARMPGYLYVRPTGRCTPQFWSSGREPWPNMVPLDSSVSKVFGSMLLERYEPGLTLLEATQRNDDIGGSVFFKLVKQSSAALLNAYSRPGFPYTAWEIKSLVLEALISDAAAALQAEQFKQANEACH